MQTIGWDTKVHDLTTLFRARIAPPFLTLVFLTLVFTSPALCQETPAPPKAKDLQFFESKIRPVLVEKCFGCHSLESGLAEGGLRLDSRDAILRGGSAGPAVIPGDIRGSLLYRAIEHKDSNLAMPPADSGERLSPEELKDFSRWIRIGAPDPRRDADHLRAREEKENSSISWWAYQPISNPAVPSTTDGATKDGVANDWAWNDIDRFIFAKLRDEDLSPANDASPEALLRRLYFDLVGLPPSPDELAAFMASLQQGSSRREAILQVVDQLLASPQFGVHFGRHWLDVARYGESTGREVNLPYNEAWRYRDWVIDAFATNMPYDRFLMEQIAGDLIPSEDERDRSRQIVATGFLAIGSRNVNEGNPKQFAVDQADEQIDSVFQATMGMTMACARCHDHKFEPISQRQYTAVAGIFLSTETLFGVSGGNNARNGSDSIELDSHCGLPVLELNWSPEEISKKRIELKEMRDQILAALEEQESIKKKKAKANGNFDRAKQQELRKLSNKANELEFQLSALSEDGIPRILAMGVADRPASPANLEAKQAKQGKLAKYMSSQRRMAFPKIDDSPFFARGEIGMPGERVPRGIPNLFGDADRHAIPREASGRLQLAQWITSQNNPLTSRVAVNRIWAWLIGRGLVDSVDNFGNTGGRPSHPELLDSLAHRFMHQGWDMKELIREIVTSRTYQLSSIAENEEAQRKDPENRLCWRGKGRRLQAEEIRDAMLMVAGRLDLSSRTGTTMAKHRYGNKVDPGLGRKRSKGEVVSDDVCRSIYLPLPRNASPEILDLFDLPDGTVVQGLREVTNVPSQALFLLNNQGVAGLAGAIAKRITSQIPGRGGDRFEARLDALYRLILSRSPSREEALLANDLFQQSENSENGWVSLARGLMATAEFRYLD
jgi:cytochrome c553